MLSRIAIILSMLLVAGCATVAPSIPADYTGPRAMLEDTAVVHSGSKADMFIAEKANGNDIENSIRQSRIASHGQGFALTTVVTRRAVIAGQPLRIGVKGRTVYAAPIQALTSTVYQVAGEVEFTPLPDARYLIRGELGETYSAVWIEDAASKEVVGKKIEIKGSAKLGFFDK